MKTTCDGFQRLHFLNDVFRFISFEGDVFPALSLRKEIVARSFETISMRKSMVVLDAAMRLGLVERIDSAAGSKSAGYFCRLNYDFDFLAFWQSQIVMPQRRRAVAVAVAASPVPLNAVAVAKILKGNSAFSNIAELRLVSNVRTILYGLVADRVLLVDSKNIRNPLYSCGSAGLEYGEIGIPTPWLFDHDERGVLESEFAQSSSSLSAVCQHIGGMWPVPPRPRIFPYEIGRVA